MSKKAIPVLRSAVLLAFLVARGAHAAPVLTLAQPVPGAPNSPAGWGFTLTNDTARWLVVTSVSASPELTALGTFTDFAAQYQFVVVAPSGVATQAFDSPTKAGAGSLLSALTNATGTGTITMTYDLYSADPGGGGFDPIASGVSWGNSVSATASFGTTPVTIERFGIE
jgi:hypothetical protein